MRRSIAGLQSEGKARAADGASVESHAGPRASANSRPHHSIALTTSVGETNTVTRYYLRQPDASPALCFVAESVPVAQVVEQRQHCICPSGLPRPRPSRPRKAAARRAMAISSHVMTPPRVSDGLSLAPAFTSAARRSTPGRRSVSSWCDEPRVTMQASSALSDRPGHI